MRHSRLLDPNQSALVIVDMQEAFRPAIAEFDAIATRIAIIAKAAELLLVPVLVTEQSPQKLGKTAKEISAPNPIEKTAFSCCGAPVFFQQLQSHNAKQILICGIEAHVCVSQTTHDLLAAGYQVHLLLDCISSRHPDNKAAGIQKMLQSGAIPSTVEMALFELMQDAQHEQFRAVQKLIK